MPPLVAVTMPTEPEKPRFCGLPTSIPSVMYVAQTVNWSKVETNRIPRSANG